MLKETYTRPTQQCHFKWKNIQWHEASRRLFATAELIVNIRYGNVAVEIIPQGTAFCYSFVVGKKNLAQMSFSLRTIQCMVRSILQDQQYMFGIKRLPMITAVLLTRKNLVAVLFRRPIQRSQQSNLSCGLTGVCWDSCV